MGQNLAEDFDVLMLGGGGDTTCAISTDNRLKCWGANAFGRLGLGDMKDRGDHAGEMGQNLADMNLGDDFEIAKVRCSVGHCCAMSTDGELKCWGNNKHGELDYEHRSNVGTRSALDGDLDVIDLGSRPDFIVADFTVNDGSTCAISTKGYSKCWGRGDEGQLEFGGSQDVGGASGDMGNSLSYNSAGRDAGLVRSKRRVASSGGSGQHFCMYEADSDAKGTCWGRNNFGQLGCGGKTMKKKKGKKKSAWSGKGKNANKNGNKKNGNNKKNNKKEEDGNRRRLPGAKDAPTDGDMPQDAPGGKDATDTQDQQEPPQTENNGETQDPPAQSKGADETQDAPDQTPPDAEDQQQPPAQDGPPDAEQQGPPQDESNGETQDPPAQSKGADDTQDQQQPPAQDEQNGQGPPAAEQQDQSEPEAKEAPADSDVT